MRLFSMYYACKRYINAVKDMRIESRKEGTYLVKYIEGWREKAAILNEIAKIPPLKEKATNLFEEVPYMLRDHNKVDLPESEATKFINARKDLVTAMETIIELYESLNTRQEENIDGGFDIKLPAFQDIGEFSRCLSDLDFILNQCPYLRNSDCTVKYGSVDVGSTWITILLIGSAASVLLLNLSKLVDTAVKIKSHVVTVKAQEEALRSLEIKTEIASEVASTFKQMNDAIINRYIAELQQEIGILKDGEEIDKTKRCVEKISFWMSKGMEIYSAIDAPKEVKDLFPTQEANLYLSDDLQKLIEMKQKEK